MKYRDFIYISLLVIFAYILWRQDNTIHELKTDTSLSDIKEERDSINNALQASEARVKILELQDTQDSLKIVAIEIRAAQSHTKIKFYENKIKELNKVVIHDLDSFFIGRYPDSVSARKRDRYFEQMESTADHTRLTHEGLFGLIEQSEGLVDKSTGDQRSASPKAVVHSGRNYQRERYSDQFIPGLKRELYQGNSHQDKRGQTLQAPKECDWWSSVGRTGENCL